MRHTRQQHTSDALAHDVPAQRPDRGTDWGFSPTRSWTPAQWEEARRTILNWCRNFLGNSRRADLSPEDASQDVLAILLRSDFAERYDPEIGPLLPLIWAITRNECLGAMAKYYRRRMDLWRSEDDRAGLRTDNPLLRAELAEFDRAFRKCLPELTESERAALPGVLDRAAGVRRPGGKSPTEHVREHRCRRKLAGLLKDFAPPRPGDVSDPSGSFAAAVT